MRREFGDLEAVARQRAADLLAIGLALCRALQIKQARIPRRNLHALIAELASPRGNALQTVERGRIARELRQKNRRSFDGSHHSLNSTPHPR